MFVLFQDTFKCGFNGKVKVKFKVKYGKIVQKRLIALLSFVIYQSFLKWEEVLYTKVNYNV